MVLRDEAEKRQKSFVPEPDGNKQVIDLLKQVVGLNNGEYLDKKIIYGNRANFCLGVSRYLEKHFDGPSMEFYLQRAKDKVDAGAQYIMIQIF